MSKAPEPPATYMAFVERYPELGRAWDLAGEAGKRGPLDPRTIRLVKLGIAMGAMREGAVHSGVRKAIAEGVTRGEIDQAIALAAGTLGFPSTVAIFSWIRETVDGTERGDATDTKSLP